MPEKDYAPFTNEEIQQAFQSGDPGEISQTLVTLALYASDWKPVEQYCLQFLEYPDAGVRRVAATCLGHLARLHKKLDLDRVLPALYKRFADPDKYVAGAADDALGDIEIFMKVPVQHLPSSQRTEDNVELEPDDEEETPLTTAEIEQAIQSGQALEIEKMLVSLTYHDPDWQRAEAYCLQFLDHPDESVRGTAVDCLYHLANQYKTLHFDRVLPALYRHRSDTSKYVTDKVEDALKYIQTYLHIPVEPLVLPQEMNSAPPPLDVQTSEQEAPAKRWNMRTFYDIARLTFLDNPLAYQCKANEVCLPVPITLSTPKELIDLLTTRLDLSPYDGSNWSKLSELLSSWDEWRITPQRVVLLHTDLPFLQASENGWRQQKLYLTVLIRSIVKIQEKNITRLPSEGPRALVTVFPAQMENDLRTLLARSVAET